MVKIFLQFYGCQANLDDGRIIKGILSKNGFKFTKNIKESDLCIIGTCVVKEKTANKIIYQLKQIYSNYQKKLIIAGCMTESESNLCKNLFPKASLVNTFHITKITKAIKDTLENKVSYFLGKRKESKLGLPKSDEKLKVMTIQIAQGCTSNCSFCESKLAKGYITSQQEDLIIKEIKYYLKKGFNRFNLSSTDNADYGKDINTNLVNLLKKVVQIKGNFKVRVGMMNPQHILPFLDDLIEVYKNDKIMKFVHIPIEAGSDKVLKEMNRGCYVKDFKKIVKKFRKIPEMNIATDIIVGFPTETKEDFNQTVNLIKEIKPEVLNISKFGPRPKTKAAQLKQLKSEVIKERSVKLSKEFKKLKK